MRKPAPPAPGLQQVPCSGRLRDLVENALYAYADAADRRDSDALGALFARCAVTFGDEVAEGRVPVEALYRRRLAAGPPMKHLISNIAITTAVRGGTTWADASCSYVRMAYRPAPRILSLGEYRAGLVVTDPEGVEFRHFQVTTQWPQAAG